MACRLRLALLAGALAATVSAFSPVSVLPARAQDLPIRLLDEDRLLGESELGRRVVARIRAEEQALEEENRQLADQLAREEQELTDARATLTPEEFRTRADAFDQRVEEIRAERAQRGEEFARFSEAEVQRFFEIAFPVIAELMREEGIVAIVKPEAVIVALEAFDITGEAIARLDDTWRAAREENEALPRPGAPDDDAPRMPGDAPSGAPRIELPVGPPTPTPTPAVPLIPDDDG